MIWSNYISCYSIIDTHVDRFDQSILKWGLTEMTEDITFPVIVKRGDLYAAPYGMEITALIRTARRMFQMSPRKANSLTTASDLADHSVRTGRYVWLLVKALSPRQLGQLHVAPAVLVAGAALHDIGKLSIPREILAKPAMLTKDEFAIVMRHPSAGYRIATATLMQRGGTSEFLTCVAEVALFHHERWDGAGYPNQVANKNIPLTARVLSVADVYDALTSARAYKTRMPHREVVEVIRDGRGSKFDPDLVDAFLSVESDFESANNESVGTE